jgi:hypothetical protein
MTLEQIAELVRLTREEQGLPPKVADPTALANVATLLQLPNELDPTRVKPVLAADGRRGDDDAV